MEEKKMEKRRIVTIGIAAIVLLVAVAVFLPNSNAGLMEQTTTFGRVEIYKDFLDGRQNVLIGTFSNTVTNIAKNQTRDIRMGTITGAPPNMTWASLMLTTGATAPAATDTTCEATIFTSNGCEAVNATVAVVTGSIGNYSITNKFEATGACDNIAKVCLSNHTDSASPLMASALISPTVSLAANENLTVIYYVAET